LSWPAVALAGLNVLQVVGLAWIAAWARTTHREVTRLNGEIEAATSAMRANTRSHR
jgi:hypothetical protein